MSGIYGFFQNKGPAGCLSELDMNNLAHWNRNYGFKGHKKALGDASFGAYIDRLNDELPVNEVVLEQGNLLSTIDAVIYNREEMLRKHEITDGKAISDEELILFLI
jgi:hypothetical protein